jgi:hypothetical protein
MALVPDIGESTTKAQNEGAFSEDDRPGERLRGEVQLQIFRSKLLMTKAHQLLSALLAVAQGRRS